MDKAGNNNKLLWGIAVLFIGLNIWLLYGKVTLQQQVNRLLAQTIREEADISIISKPIQFTGSNSAGKVPLDLVVVFTNTGCTSCIAAEIEYLNEWNETFNERLQVYYLGTANEYLEDFGAQFDYNMAESVRDLFTVAMPLGNPFSVIIDGNSNVQVIHTNDLSRPGSDRRRALFYERAESLFRSVYGTQ